MGWGKELGNRSPAAGPTIVVAFILRWRRSIGLQQARYLDIEGAHNVRDLGGYPALDGRRTRWKTFVRAGSLDRLPPPSRAALVEYGIRTVIDLRRTNEVEEAPNVFASSSQVTYHHQNMLGDEPLAGTDDSVATGVAAERILAMYCPWLDLCQPQIRRTLETLAEPDARPAMYHCAAGKDRTGVISALLLGLAGVPAEVIAEDYALSARYLLERYLAQQASPELAPDNYTHEDYRRDFCPPDAMLKVLDYVNERYGGIEAYVLATGLRPGQIESIRTALVE
jgi:protein-tyrosine phosphatase